MRWVNTIKIYDAFSAIVPLMDGAASGPSGAYPRKLLLELAKKNDRRSVMQI
jgi:hypothetical protein